MIYAAPVPEAAPVEQPMIYAAPAGGAPMTYTAAPQYIDAAPITTTGGSAAMAQPMMMSQPIMYAAPQQTTFTVPQVAPAPEYAQYITAEQVYGAPPEYAAAPMTYTGAPMAYSAPVQYASAPMTYSAPVQYASAPMVYSSAPVQYTTAGPVDAFAQMDTNGDGTLSREEFAAAMGR